MVTGNSMWSKRMWSKRMPAATVQQWASLALPPQPLALSASADARTVPSPTLSPTDPVPRGLLTLCPPRRTHEDSTVTTHEDSTVTPSHVLLPPRTQARGLSQHAGGMAEQGGSAAGRQKTRPCAAVRPQMAPYVPPLKLSFLSQADEGELKQRPTPAVRGVRTHWPLLAAA
jgi:hypothetical protein